MGRPEWDEEVSELTEQLGLGRVKIPDSEFSEEFYIDKYGIELEFGYLPRTEKQYAEEEVGNLYYNQVSFSKNCTMTLPFGLKRGETFLQCIKKILKVTTPLYRRRWDVIDDLLIEKDGLKYLFVIRYLEDGTRKLRNIVVYPMDIKHDYSKFKNREVPLDVE